MRIRTSLIIAIAALSLTSFDAALADEPPGGSPPQAATYMPAAADAGEVVCKDVKQLGSRVQTKKVCMTRGDWEIQQRSAKETTEEWQRHGAPQQGH